MLWRQIKGIIAIGVILAFIPFVIYWSLSRTDTDGPILSRFESHKISIEIAAENGASGVYFVEPGTSVGRLFTILKLDGPNEEDIKLRNGMKLRLVSEGGRRRVVVEKMEAASRLALGLPVDINTADRNELNLIPGIGEVLAENIVAMREKIGRFDKMEQLTKIKGIKERKLAKIRPYLCVDDPVN